jgi:hypothetical protein
MAAEDDIRSAGKGRVMKPEAQPPPVQAASHQQFWPGPGSADAAHVEAARLGGVHVRHVAQDLKERPLAVPASERPPAPAREETAQQAR